MSVETTSFRAFGGLEEAGLGADGGNEGVDSTLALRSSEMCWPDWMSGSGTLPVSRVCDTVVMPARRGGCIVAFCDWSKERRIVRANSAMVTVAMADAVLFSISKDSRSLADMQGLWR